MLFVLLWLNWFLRTHAGVGAAVIEPSFKTDDLPLLLITLVIGGAAGWEVSQVVRRRYPSTGRWNGVYAATLLIFIMHAIRLTSVGMARPSLPVSSVGLLIDSLGSTAAVMLLFLAVWSDIEQRGREGMVENLYVVLIGLYLGIAMSCILLLGETPPHELAVLLLFVLVFGLDTTAYFCGKLLHGPKLAPAISPGKTISGAACGLLAAVLLAVLFKLLLTAAGAHLVNLIAGVLSGFKAVPIPASALPLWLFIGHTFSWPRIIVLALAIGIFGELGDLLESLFKRWGGVKDSGSVIPGHGGFLDRFDSLFLAAPVCYVLMAFYFHFPLFT